MIEIFKKLLIRVKKKKKCGFHNNDAYSKTKTVLAPIKTVRMDTDVKLHERYRIIN